ncbi:hypothetical protein HBI56_072940 [Parastagonospora nodorum]|nr:hypothetical protein HBH61_108690 [Parastagonospora nodorum]KAH6525500.1 hypothetical protein HBI56_072940 [Parastagonospora nodorum]
MFNKDIISITNHLQKTCFHSLEYLAFRSIGNRTHSRTVKNDWSSDLNTTYTIASRQKGTPFTFSASPTKSALPKDLCGRFYMSTYSSSSVNTEFSEFSNPPAQRYHVPNSTTMSGRISSAEKEQYIYALRTHQVNTLVELRRIEKAFAVLGTPDVSEPMTAAWSYYVDSHGLLTELRGLTKKYPFSSHCLDEAKNRVYSDPASNRSWNLCWLVLSKIQTDQLVPYYARYQASQPTMWGGHTPSSEQITQLTAAFVAEWNYAVGQMLRHWAQPPVR